MVEDVGAQRQTPGQTHGQTHARLSSSCLSRGSISKVRPTVTDPAACVSPAIGQPVSSCWSMLYSLSFNFKPDSLGQGIRAIPQPNARLPDMSTSRGGLPHCMLATTSRVDNTACARN